MSLIIFKHSILIILFPDNPQIAQKQPPMCPQTLKDDNLTISDDQSENSLIAEYKGMGYKGFITNFVSNEIFVVVVQYRLVIHGFITTFTDEITPNRDPEKITLAGHSTSAVSVNAQGISPLSGNLYQDLFIMSCQVNLEFLGTVPLLGEGSVNDEARGALTHADDFFALTMRPEFFDSPNSNFSTVTDYKMIHKLGTYWPFFIKSPQHNDEIMDNYHEKQDQLKKNSSSKIPTTNYSYNKYFNYYCPSTAYINNQYSPCNNSLISSIALSMDYVSDSQFQGQLNILLGNNIIEPYWNHFERIAVVSYDLKATITINSNSLRDKNTFNNVLLKNVERINNGNSTSQLFNLLTSNNFASCTNRPVNNFIFVTATYYYELRLQYNSQQF
uniref:COesterase domain-containing protein n=1 Tax=Strongyloides papillosus TaxID=174720 RepID=A0A0N5BRE5_STREA